LLVLTKANYLNIFIFLAQGVFLVLINLSWTTCPSTSFSKTSIAHSYCVGNEVGSKRVTRFGLVGNCFAAISTKGFAAMLAVIPWCQQPKLRWAFGTRCRIFVKHCSLAARCDHRHPLAPRWSDTILLTRDCASAAAHSLAAQQHSFSIDGNSIGLGHHRGRAMAWLLLEGSSELLWKCFKKSHKSSL
jgi:hypothetical protein